MPSHVVVIGGTGGGPVESDCQQLDERVMDNASSGGTFEYYCVLCFRVETVRVASASYY